MASAGVIENPGGAGAALPAGVQGDVLYHDGSDWVVLNAGAAGLYLQTQGAGADPTWAAFGGAAVYAPVFLAANDATAIEKLVATASGGAICDGVADEIEIQAEIAAGTRVMLSSGTFVIAAEIDMDQDDSVLEGQGSGITILQRGAGPLNIHIIHTTADNLVIKNMTFDGNGDSASELRAAVYIDGSDTVTVRDNEIFNLTTGVYVTGLLDTNVASNIWILHNDMHQLFSAGVRLWDGITYCHIENNTIHNIDEGLITSLYGIAIDGVGSRSTVWQINYVWMVHNKIYDLVAPSADSEGINLAGGSHIYAIDNDIEDVDQGIYFQKNNNTDNSDDEDFSIVNNHIKIRATPDASTWGIRVENVSGVNESMKYILIDGNSIEGLGDTAILVFAVVANTTVEYVDIINNKIWNHASATATSIAIYVRTHSSGTIRYGNISSNLVNGFGASARWDTCIQVQGGIGFNVDHNTLVDFEDYGIYMSQNADDSSVRDNYIETGQAGSRGLYIFDADDAEVTGNRINVASEGIAIGAAAVRTSIHGNNWEGSAAPYIDGSATDPWFHKNRDVNGDRWFYDDEGIKLTLWVADDITNPTIATIPQNSMIWVTVWVEDVFDNAATLEIGYDADNGSIVTAIDLTVAGRVTIAYGVDATLVTAGRIVEAYVKNAPTIGKAVIVLEVCRIPPEVA